MSKTYPHSNVLCRVGISKIHGVGLIAIVDIPKNTIFFTGKEEPAEIVPRDVVAALPSGQRKLYEDFGVLIDDGYVVPPQLDKLTVGWFFNHSDKPNVGCRKYYHHGIDFFALTKIKAGTEMTLNYDTYEKVYLDLELKRFKPNRKSVRK